LILLYFVEILAGYSFLCWC